MGQTWGRPRAHAARPGVIPVVRRRRDVTGRHRPQPSSCCQTGTSASTRNVDGFWLICCLRSAHLRSAAGRGASSERLAGDAASKRVRAVYRDADGERNSQTFATRKEAKAFLAATVRLRQLERSRRNRQGAHHRDARGDRARRNGDCGPTRNTDIIGRRRNSIGYPGLSPSAKNSCRHRRPMST